MRLLIAVATLTMVGCAYDWDGLDPRVGGGGGAASASSSSVATSSSPSSSSGSGGMVSFCGDGTVDLNEECDDGDTVSGDGCDADCRVECADRLRPETLHCYAFEAMPLSWSSAQAACAARGPGWNLAGLTDTDEVAFVVADPQLDATLVTDDFVWVGGQDQQTEGQFAYVNGEAFPSDLWHPTQPDDHMMNEDCVDLWRSSGMDLLNDDRCTKLFASLCERFPPGVGP